MKLQPQSSLPQSTDSNEESKDELILSGKSNRRADWFQEEKARPEMTAELMAEDLNEEADEEQD